MRRNTLHQSCREPSGVSFLSCVALLAGTAFSQSTEPSLKFEAADVHVSPKTRNEYLRGPFRRNGLYELRLANMVDLIRIAYGVEADKVLGGPNWLEMDRFDVTTKLPADSTPETGKIMLQALLADRFKLVLHKDTRSIPGYQLTAGKHPLLKKSEGTGDTGCKFIPPVPPAPGSGPFLPVFAESCRNMTMAAFVAALPNMPGTFQYLSGETAVDKTDLPGAWDFDFKYSLRGAPIGAPGETITFFDAIEKQLGLKLEASTFPMPVLVVDSVNEKPTDNMPGVVEGLHIPPVPTEFEVAEVKLTPPDSKGLRFQIMAGGKVNLEGATLKTLIQQAWNLTDDMIQGAPKWLDADKYDIVAKAPSYNGEIDFDEVMVMLRGLLAERFKLAVHMEERPVSAYTLVAAKPKLRKADPASRTLYHEGPAIETVNKDPRNTNPARSRLVSCQNMTMAQFAERLQDMAPGYIHSPVLDATGIDGAWDFTLSWSPVGLFQPGASPSDTAIQASDPEWRHLACLRLYEKQLGLKLDMQKRPVPVLVIDHVEEKPTDN